MPTIYTKEFLYITIKKETMQNTLKVILIIFILTILPSFTLSFELYTEENLFEQTNEQGIRFSSELANKDTDCDGVPDCVNPADPDEDCDRCPEDESYCEFVFEHLGEFDAQGCWSPEVQEHELYIVTSERLPFNCELIDAINSEVS